MIRFKSFMLPLMVAIVQLFAGCDKLATEPQDEAVMVLDVYELKVTGGGGVIPIYYGVENPRPGARPKVSSSVAWITVKEITNSAIMLNVAPSDVSEERFGFVTITYDGMVKPIKVPVLQNEQILDKFGFEVIEKTSTTCSVKYTPKQSGQLFMANIIDSAYFTQSGITDMEMFVAAEMANYLSIAQQYDITLQYLLEEAASPKVVYTSEVTRKFSGMKSGGTYVAYAYGIELKDNEYTLTIPVHKVSITLPVSALYDVKFNVSAQETTAGIASIAVSPANWSGYYSISVIPESSVYYVPKGEAINEYALRAIGDEFYKRARQALQGGMSVEAFLRGSCYTGSQTFNLALSAGVRYMVAVYAVESVDGGIPVMCSAPTLSYL